MACFQAPLGIIIDRGFSGPGWLWRSQGGSWGAGTDNLKLDQAAMSVKLDRTDIEYLVSENIKALSASILWNVTIEKAEKPPVVAIWPIQNATSQHIEDQMAALLSSIETYLVNSGDVRVDGLSRWRFLRTASVLS